MQKLQAYPQQNALAQALQEYGRLVRTLHVLRWYANNEDRRRVMRQLNKGEALHDLRAYLMIANKGQLRRKRGEELVNQASCLNLVTNAVIVWNTVYMAEAVPSSNGRVIRSTRAISPISGRPGMSISMSMAGITSTLRRHGDGRAYDRCGNRAA